MFASQITKVIQIGEVSVKVRKLSWKSLRNAAEKHTDGAMAVASKVSPDLMRLFSDTAKGNRPEEGKPDPLARYRAYDRGAVLQAGIASWTADAKLPEGIDDLDEEHAERLFREIVDLSVPTPEQEEAARKNG